MERTTRVQPAEITGLKGALITRVLERKLGKVPAVVGVYWHVPRVLFAMSGFGSKVQKWDACDEALKSYAHMAVAVAGRLHVVPRLRLLRGEEQGARPRQGARGAALARGGRLHAG